MQTADGAPDREAALTIVNAMPEIARAAHWLDAFFRRAALAGDPCERMQVVLDEVLTNVIGHGLEGAPAGRREIVVRVRRTPDWLLLEVSDDGPAFDPTIGRPTSAAARIAAPQIGGVGLLLVRSLLDELGYERAAGRNRLTLGKRLSVPASKPLC